MIYQLTKWFICIPLVVASVTAMADYNLQRRIAYDFDLYESVLDPELCQKHLHEMDAFEFYDASFRIPQSILKLSTFSIGNYHQCLAINQPLEDGPIRGKYCLIRTENLRLPILTGNSWPANVTWVELTNVWSDQNLDAYKEGLRQFTALNHGDNSRTSVIDIFNNVPLTLALCVPRSCRVEDVLSPLVDGEFDYVDQFCRLPDDKPQSGADIAAFVIFSIMGCLTLISTTYELNHIFIKKATEKPDELLSCFSVYGNTARLMTLDGSTGSLSCLDGIRSISILWVIFGHTFLVYFSAFVINIVDFYEWSAKLRAVFLMAADVSVDSFFTLSGLLLVYTSAQKMKQMQLVKGLHMFYLHRLLRMFPLLAVAVLLQASVFHQVSDGVRWDPVALETQRCRDHWWSALLHVQNFVNPLEMCLTHTWYLSVDVQLHILSPLLLFWALGSRRAAWVGLTTGVLGCLTVVTVYCFIKQFSGPNDEFTVYFYQNPLTRSPPFVVGMLCGYVLHCSRGKKMKMDRWVVCSGYALAMVMSGYCMYRVYPDWSHQLWVNLNNAFMRASWSASLCWLIVACVNGYSGPINWFLSLKMWKFVARISYAMYIFHVPIQFATNGANIMPVHFSMESAFLYYMSDVAYTMIVSTAACILFDAPFSTLFRRMMIVITPNRTPLTPVKEQVVPETKHVESKNATE